MSEIKKETPPPPLLPPTTTINNAPKYGTLVPNRIFVGGIAANTTESELLSLFSAYGTVKAAKIIQDRAGVSKGYGFITFESEDDAKRPLREADSIVLRERKLNIAPAIKKQPFNFNRAFDGSTPPTMAAPPPQTAAPAQYFLPPAAAYFAAAAAAAASWGAGGAAPQSNGNGGEAQQVFQAPPQAGGGGYVFPAAGAPPPQTIYMPPPPPHHHHHHQQQYTPMMSSNFVTSQDALYQPTYLLLDSLQY